MVSVAVISDIHNSLPAFDAALERIDGIGPDAIHCGGDLVGYGHLAEKPLTTE